MAGIPHRMGPYEIRAKIGAGGMGVVYEGWDDRLSRRVAVKTLWPEVARDPDARERFLREAKAAAAISHPNVTQIYDIGEEDGHAFFAMEYLQGQSLQDLLAEEGRLSPERAVSLIRQAAAGLKAAADRGIVHRDVKPANFVLTTDGTLKVTDFGIAKLDVADSSLTVTGQVIGTPYYVSPELASGATIDIRGDIYSLGATLYQMVTGRLPFDGPSGLAVIMKHVNEPLPAPRRFNPELPYPLASLIQKMMAKRPEGRPQDYDALLEHLDRIAGSLSRPGAGPAAPSRSAAKAPLPGPATVEAPSRSFVVPLAMLTLAALGLWIVVDQLGGSPTEPPTLLSAGPEHAGGSEGAAVAPPLDVSTRTGSGPTQMLPAPAKRADLKIADSSHEFTESGLLRIMGQVTNVGDARATGAKVRVELKDEAGAAIRTEVVSLSPASLRPGDAGNFEALFPDPKASFQVQIEVTWNW